MEMQYFIKPGTQVDAMEMWKQLRWQWHLDNGLRPERLRWKKHEELAHYADAAFDIEYEFAHGWGEMEGIHSRTDFDLKQHVMGNIQNLENSYMIAHFFGVQKEPAPIFIVLAENIQIPGIIITCMTH
jgi:glycyl-tRNA synthetase